MGQSEETVKVTKPTAGITVITINRQERRNAVDAETAKKLYLAVMAFEHDPTQKVDLRPLTCCGGNIDLEYELMNV